MCCPLTQQKEVVAKKEEEKRKTFMREQRQKTIQRVKQYMEVSHWEHDSGWNPNVDILGLLLEKSCSSQEVTATLPETSKQDTRRKQPEKKTQPTPSRVSTAATLTKSMYTRKPSDPVTPKSKATGGPKKTRGVRVTGQASQTPSVPPPSQSVQAIAAAAKNLPPPPPPPPTSAPPPPPPLPQANGPTQPAPKPRTPHESSPAKQPTTTVRRRDAKPKPTSGGGGGINLNAIITARQKLKQTEFGKALGAGGLTDTSAEVACLIRSGGKPDSSLTSDAAGFLRQRFQHLQNVTRLSDSESDSEGWD